MITKNLSTLKIHKLTQAQYDRELAAGNIDENALYLTPEEAIDLSPYATIESLSVKSDVGHTHDDMYYTETEIDTKIEDINISIEDIIDGTTVVAEANHAVSADDATSATNATKATQDASGNVITSTYETKTDASTKLTEAKAYADTIKNDLLNGAGEAYDTLKELGDLIDTNVNAIEALETVASGKQNKITGVSG